MFLEALTVALSISVVVMAVIGVCGQTPMLTKHTAGKAKPIECGFEDRLKSSRSPFSLFFFILSVLFLVFDVETVLLFPSPLAINYFQNTNLYLGIFFFLFILLGGLIHETRQGALQWA